ELKTLSYFGFNGSNQAPPEMRRISSFTRQNITNYGLWGLKKNDSYLQPLLNEMLAKAKSEYDQFIRQGGKTDQIDYYLLMDEPFGSDAHKLAKDSSAAIKFREWLHAQQKSLNELFPTYKNVSWDMVKPVEDSE